MNIFRALSSTLAIACTVAAFAASPSLKITQGKKESTTNPQHVVVATTEPGNKAFINGKEVRIQKPVDAINAGIGFVTEERKLNGFVWMLSIRDNMFLASLKELAGKGPFIVG